MGPAITISAGFVSLRAKCPYRDRVVLCASIFALRDRKSTRLNSSHGYISYAVFCLKKKKDKLDLESRETREVRGPGFRGADLRRCAILDAAGRMDEYELQTVERAACW